MNTRSSASMLLVIAALTLATGLLLYAFKDRSWMIEGRERLQRRTLTASIQEQPARTEAVVILDALGLMAQHKAPQLNEIMTRNRGAAADARAGTSDWIELYNPHDEPLALGEFFLTDDPSAPAKWALPRRMLAPGAYTIVWASGLAKSNEMQANFRLSSYGEYVGLYERSGALADSVEVPFLGANRSYARLPGTNVAWQVTTGATPGTANRLTNRSPVSASALFAFLDTAPPGDGLPIVALQVASNDLWDVRTGIYRNARKKGMAWERTTQVGILRPNGERQAFECGIRIHGGSARKESKKLSFRLHVGSPFGYDEPRSPLVPGRKLIGERYVLRASYNDSFVQNQGSYLRDPLAHRIFRDMGHPSPDGQFVRLYLNGTFWGLYNLCEAVDESFLESRTGIADWRLLEWDEELSTRNKAFLDLKELYWNQSVVTHDGYQQLARHVDMASLADILLLYLYIQGGDIQYVWARERNMPLAKWKLIPWDIEFLFGKIRKKFAEKDRLLDVVEADRAARLVLDDGQVMLGRLLTRLIRSNAFNQFLLDRLALHDEALDDNRIARIGTAWAEAIAPVIHEELERWKPSRFTVDDWSRHKDYSLRTFLPGRRAKLRSFIEGWIRRNDAIYTRASEHINISLDQEFSRHFSEKGFHRSLQKESGITR